MNAIAVVKAGEWAVFADRLVERLRRLNPGVPVFVLDPRALPVAPESEWTKAWLWDFLPSGVDQVVCCDANIFPLQPFPQRPETDFAGVRELRFARAADRLCMRRGGVPVEYEPTYFNSGVLVVSRRTEKLFEELKRISAHPTDAAWGEQTWLNILAYRHGLEDRLPAPWNYLKIAGKPRPPDVWAFQYARMPEEPQRLALERLHAGEGELPAFAMPGAQWQSYAEEPWPNRVTFAVAGKGLGDVWRSVQYACHIHAVQGAEVELYCRWHGWPGADFSVSPQADQEALAEEIRAVLDTPGRFRLVREVDLSALVWLQWLESWRFPLVPSRIRWKGWTHGLRRRIAYQLDGSVGAGEKNPTSFLRRIVRSLR